MGWPGDRTNRAATGTSFEITDYRYCETRDAPTYSIAGHDGRLLPQNRPPTHPGEMVLEEFLKPLGISKSEFATRLGVSFAHFNDIIRGKRGVTPDTALRLARLLGMSADFWLGLQLDWDLWHAMTSKKAAELALLEPVRRLA